MVSRPIVAILLILESPGLQATSAQFYNDWAAERFTDIPSQGGFTNDPDGDGEKNLVEFAFGTDPRAAGGLTGAVDPVSVSATGPNGLFSVNVLERNGHEPGAQIDLYLSSNLTTWFRPWWLRTATNLKPGDPFGSMRESFTTHLPATNIWFVRSSVELLDAGPEAARYYVATNGNNSNSGSANAPFATLAKAASVANAGNLIYVRGGTYHWTSQVSLSRSGTAAQPIRVRAYPGEHPLFDFSGEPSGSAGFQINGNCWRLYGLEIARAGHNGIKITGNSNVVERCVVHESGDTGIHMTVGSFNLVLNCDSYRNYDPPIGGNADGFSAKFTLGPGNVFSGCRSWNNSDDGWDLWQATNTVVIENCITFSNGFNVFDGPTNTSFNGNGNGFKLGGNYYFGPHRISHCISFGNKVNGYDQNNNISGLIVDNNTAWANGGRNFNLNHGPNITPHVVRNNLSIAGGNSDSFRPDSLLTNNSWQVVSPAATAIDVSEPRRNVHFGAPTRRWGPAGNAFLAPRPRRTSGESRNQHRRIVLRLSAGSWRLRDTGVVKSDRAGSQFRRNRQASPEVPRLCPWVC